MATQLTLRLKPYIQPFEFALAMDELRAVTEGEPQPASLADDEYSFNVSSVVTAREAANRLAYWERVLAPKPATMLQTLRESTVNVVRNGVPMADIRRQLPFAQEVPIPNRRCLRYGPHGIHEYRGKFFPQLVRSLLNIAKVPRQGVVVDPMCGSGTTIVESVLGGFQCHGLDMNPLSVAISQTKCLMLNSDPDAMEAAYANIKDRLLRDDCAEADYFATLPIADVDYLQAWIAPPVLKDISVIMSAIASSPDRAAQSLFRISLSNILRKVSWQKVEDLRIRKDVRPDADDDAVREFLEEVGRSIRFVVAFLRQNGRVKRPRYTIQGGDARQADKRWARLRGKVDAVITSPPYATALPYLDTDRLSLCCLGLLTRPEHRRKDDEMIGNREVTQRGRRAYWALYENNSSLLPEAVHEVIHRIQSKNADTDAGFRRRNLPALLAKYFLDMRLVLQSIHSLLKQDSPAYIVVGNNHTIAGGERVEIHTASLLSEIAATLGFTVCDPRPMDMLHSRDIFKKNAVASEFIVELRA